MQHVLSLDIEDRRVGRCWTRDVKLGLVLTVKLHGALERSFVFIGLHVLVADDMHCVREYSGVILLGSRSTTTCG